MSAPLLAVPFGLLRRGLRKRLDDPADAARWFFEGPARGAQVDAVAEYVAGSTPEDLRAELTDFPSGTRATRAIVQDLRAYVQPWSFDPASVSTRVEI